MSRATAQPTEPVTEIRIQDPYIIQLIAQEQDRTGEKSATKVAARLISERIAIREVRSEPEPSAA